MGHYWIKKPTFSIQWWSFKISKRSREEALCLDWTNILLWGNTMIYWTTLLPPLNCFSTKKTEGVPLLTNLSQVHLKSSNFDSRLCETVLLSLLMLSCTRDTWLRVQLPCLRRDLQRQQSCSQFYLTSFHQAYKCEVKYFWALLFKTPVLRLFSPVLIFT